MSTFGQHYLLFPPGPSTQGDIWSNLPFPTLHPASGLGLIITPRCDFAHEKTAVFNYIPAIDLSTYLATATRRLLEREMVRLREQLRSLDLSLPAFALLEIGVPPKLVLPELEQNLAHLPDPSRRVSSAVDRFREILERIGAIEELLNLEEIKYPQAKAVVGDREVRKFREQVIRNQLQDLHTLPPCPGAFDRPLVLLLRYVTSPSPRPRWFREDARPNSQDA